MLVSSSFGFFSQSNKMIAIHQMNKTFPISHSFLCSLFSPHAFQNNWTNETLPLFHENAAMYNYEYMYINFEIVIKVKAAVLEYFILYLANNLCMTCRLFPKNVFYDLQYLINKIISSVEFHFVRYKSVHTYPSHFPFYKQTNKLMLLILCNNSQLK